MPSAMQMFFEVALFARPIWLCGMIGTTSQATNQIALSLAFVNLYVCDGIERYGNDSYWKPKGLEDYVTLRKVAISIFLLTIIIEVVFALLFVLLQ